VHKIFAKPWFHSFNCAVQFQLELNPVRLSSARNLLSFVPLQISVALVKNSRARRYVLRLLPDGSARVTIPRGGSVEEAASFARRHTVWIERALDRRMSQPVRPAEWFLGTEIFLKGELVRIEADGGQSVRFGVERLSVSDSSKDLRTEISHHLWRLAGKEIPPVVMDISAVHQLRVQRISIRNQRSRWGSCSVRGTVSLNWRLIQAPPDVLRYVVIHELMHLKQMNHSRKFWQLVEQAFPAYGTAEKWLKEHASLLR